MKKILVFICYILCSLTHAQSAFERFEAFGINKTYGLMEYGYGTEIVAPQYKNVNLKFTDYIALYNDQEYDFYQKETGEKLSLKDEQQPYINIKNTKHQHFTDNTSSYLLPFTVKNRIKLPKKYNSLSITSNYLVAFLNNEFTIFDSINISTPKINSIKANTYSEEFVIHNNEFKKIIVFWGIQNIYVYDKDFHLIKSYKSTSQEHEKVLKIIHNDFPIADTKEMMYPSVLAAKVWYTSYNNNETTISIYSDSTKKFTISGKYNANDIPNTSDFWIDLQSEEGKDSYQFRVDFKNKLFLLPAKYITELELKFL